MIRACRQNAHVIRDCRQNAHGKRADLFLGKTQREDADFHALRLQNLRTEGHEGGTCGDDVVDEKDVPAHNQGGTDKAEHAGNILVALPRGLMGLTGGEPRPPHSTGQDGNMRNGTDAAGYLHALVISAPDDAPPGERYRQQAADAVEESRRLIFLGYKRPKSSPTSGWSKYFSR